MFLLLLRSRSPESQLDAFLESLDKEPESFVFEKHVGWDWRVLSLNIFGSLCCRAIFGSGWRVQQIIFSQDTYVQGEHDQFCSSCTFDALGIFHGMMVHDRRDYFKDFMTYTEGLC
jgi:hypothetical protein